MQHLGLKQRAYQIIKDKLLNLEFEPGSRIREDLLANEISMSRTPVREAINQLAAEGLITIIPRKGIFCIDFSLNEIKGLLDVRQSLEKLAFEKCFELVDDKQLKNLEQLNVKFEQALASKQYKRCNELDSEFHIAIAKVSKNKKLVEFIIEIEEFMHIVRHLEKKTDANEKNSTALKQHKVIIQCIKSRDLQRAINELENNIKSMKEHLGIN
ncbi:MAG: GntR family transcriptional regulator [Christensenellales bacterium]|jgi:DNA-binding GntR family transcriptional regulator